MKKIAITAIAAAAALGFTMGAQAQANSWVVKAGLGIELPRTDGIKNGYSGTVSLEHLFTQNFGVEVQTAFPYSHKIKAYGEEIGKFKAMPVNVTALWHFIPDAQVSPFVGAGLNYTVFSKEKSDFVSKFDIKNTFGAQLRAGLDVNFTKQLVGTFDVRWTKLKPKASFEDEWGRITGKESFNPWTLGVSVGYRF
jgi:outer membrane protein